GPALHRTDEGRRVRSSLIDEAHDGPILEMELDGGEALVRRTGIGGGVGPRTETLIGPDLGAIGIIGGIDRPVDIKPVASLWRPATGADDGHRIDRRDIDLQVLLPPVSLLRGGADRTKPRTRCADPQAGPP